LVQWRANRNVRVTSCPTGRETRKEETRQLELLGVDGKIILEWMLGRLEGVEWIDLAQEGDQWRDPVNSVINLRVSTKGREFFE
jgi:hypothetical protein